MTLVCSKLRDATRTRHRGNGSSPVLRGRGNREEITGFTLAEILIAVVILTASIGSLAILASNQWRSSKDVDVLDKVENAVARDLGWLKSYAKYWRMNAGPYDLCPSGFLYTAVNDYTCKAPSDSPRSGASAYTRSNTTLSYEPDRSDLNENRCDSASDLAKAFISSAQADAAKTLFSPNRPFELSTGTIPISGLPKGMTLTRTISYTDPTASTKNVNNIIYLSYSLNTGSSTSSYRFRREVALRPEAASWCP